MKFGQLTEFNMRNILFEKSFTKYGGEIISRPFSKISIDLWINSLKFYSLFLLYAKLRAIKIY